MGGSGAIDLAAKAQGGRHRQTPAVIDVRVGDDDGIEQRKVDLGSNGIAGLVGGRALEHAEIHENARLFRADQCAASSDLAGGAVEFERRAYG